MKPADCILFSGGAAGAEAEFGACAERHGVEEVNFTFEGHQEVRRRGLRALNHEELQAGDVSLEYVSRLMNRRYAEGIIIRKVLQSLWYQVNSGQEIYVIGTILPDNTVTGRHGLGRRVREAVQQAAARVRPGQGPVVQMDRDRMAAARRAGRPDDHSSSLHGNRHAQPAAERPPGHRTALRSFVPRLIER